MVTKAGPQKPSSENPADARSSLYDPTVANGMSDAPLEEMIALAREHVRLEERGKLDQLVATLEDDCLYELQPMGLRLEGVDLARRYYTHFFGTFLPLVVDYSLRSEWVNDRGLGQEYTIWTRSGSPDTLERHDVVGILTFGSTKLSGERLYASQRALRLMFGALYDSASLLGNALPGA
jgi:hypothetical protein